TPPAVQRTHRRPRRPRRHVRRVDVSDWLVDKSAITRLHAASDSEEWAARIDRGLVRIASVTLLEIGYSARSGVDHAEALDTPPVASMPIEYQTPKIEDRAIEV